MAKKNREAWVREAAEHHTNLCTFGHIIAIIEANNIRGSVAQSDADAIVRRAKVASASAYVKYEDAVRKANECND